jgi:hypothetical protein
VHAFHLRFVPPGLALGHEIAPAAPEKTAERGEDDEPEETPMKAPHHAADNAADFLKDPSMPAAR